MSNLATVQSVNHRNVLILFVLLCGNHGSEGVEGVGLLRKSLNQLQSYGFQSFTSR